MFIEKITGSEDGRFLTIGGTTFVTLPNYWNNQDRCDRIQGNWVGEYVPYAISNGDGWIVSENPKSLQGYRNGVTGRVIVAVCEDKKKRLKRKAFLDLWADAYRAALLKEADSALELATLYAGWCRHD